MLFIIAVSCSGEENYTLRSDLQMDFIIETSRPSTYMHEGQKNIRAYA